MILIYTTHKDRASAEKITKVLLDERLVACANYLPIESCFWWHDIVTAESELVALYKTQERLWELVKQKIEEIHPYQIPCIIRLQAEANDAYEEWINKETTHSSD